MRIYPMKKNSITTYSFLAILCICVTLLILGYMNYPVFEVLGKVRLELIGLALCMLVAILFCKGNTQTRWVISVICVITMFASYSSIRKVTGGRMYFYKNKLEFIPNGDINHIDMAYDALMDDNYKEVAQHIDSCSEVTLQYFSYSTEKMKELSRTNQFLVGCFEDMDSNHKLTPKLFQTLDWIAINTDNVEISQKLEEKKELIRYHISCIDSLELASIWKKDVDIYLCHSMVDRHGDFWFDEEFVKLLNNVDDEKFTKYLYAAYEHMKVECDNSAVKYLENVWGIH